MAARSGVPNKSSERVHGVLLRLPGFGGRKPGCFWLWVKVQCLGLRFRDCRFRMYDLRYGKFGFGLRARGMFKV